MTVVIVRGLGDIGSAVAHLLFREGYGVVLHDDPRQWQRYHVHNASVSELALVPLALLDFDRVDHLRESPP